MAFAEAVPFPTADTVGYCELEVQHDRTIVWLRGEHDCATSVALAGTLANVIRDHRTDVLIDLSDVQFMGAATIRVLEQARINLAEQSRVLRFRAPSSSARRVLDLCALSYIDASPGFADAVIPIGRTGL